MHASIVNSFPTDLGARSPSALAERRDTGDFHRVLDRTLRDEPIRRDPAPPETERSKDSAARERDDVPPGQRDRDTRPETAERSERPDGNSPTERVETSDPEPETAGATETETQDAEPASPVDAAVQDATSADDNAPIIVMTGTILPIETPQTPKTETLNTESVFAVPAGATLTAPENGEASVAGATESPPNVPATPAADAGKATEAASTSPASVAVNSEVTEPAALVRAASAPPPAGPLVQETAKEGLPAVAASGTPRRTEAGAAAAPAVDDSAVETPAQDGDAIDNARPSAEPKAANGATASTPTATPNANAAQGEMQAGAPAGEKADGSLPPKIPTDRLLRADAQNAAAPEVRAAPPAPPSTQGAAPATSFASELRAATDISSGATARMTQQPAVQQLAVQISRANEAGQDRLTVNLKPADLGSVSIKLELGHDNRVIAMIQAERPDTLDLLQRDARTLERALSDAGMNTDSGSLNFSLQDGGTGFTSGDDAGTGRTASLAIPDSGINDSTPTHYAPADDGTGVDINV